MSDAISDPIFSRDYEINSLLVNSQGRLGLYALLNLIQDIGWEHANSLGHGHSETLERKAMWVLTRQHTAMKRWPKWGSRVHVRTWLRPTSNAFVTRDYEIILNDEVIGHGTSSFVLLNAETRKPLRDNIGQIDFPSREDGKAPFDAEKIAAKSTGELENLAQFQVRNSDIDGNRHVNNTRYAQWILDALPFASHEKFTLSEYEVCFIHETKLGDVISIQSEPVPPANLSTDPTSNLSTQQAFFQGVRTSDQKVMFTARIRFS